MNQQSPRVLIVDDLPINRMVLSSMLKTQGITSDQVESGIECLEICKNKNYDLILLDHRMPDLDGVDTLVELKELFKEKGKETPVICHTTIDAKDNVNLYKAAGFADVIIKPVEPKELFEIIMTYLDIEPDTSNNNYIDNSMSLTDSDNENLDEINVETELEKLPMWLKLVPHIDLVKGVSNCGSSDDYLEALYIFHRSIEEKSDELTSFLRSENLTMYALRIHSLKSMALLVGAKKLGETAAELEEAARNNDLAFVSNNTRDFLIRYREFINLLSPIEGEESSFSSCVGESADNDVDTSSLPDYNKSILFIQNKNGMLKKAIKNTLTDAGFSVISIPDDPGVFISHRNDANIIIYYPEESETSHIGITMNLLGEICQDDSKILCLVGNDTDIDKAMRSNGSHRVSKCFERPIDSDNFISDMNYFSNLLQDYHSRKSIFVVDDDNSYLSILKHWLSADYNVSTFNTGDDILNGLSAIIPDLLLLDLEMPEMDGCELMKKIRATYPDKTIPIIFLTGKNDKDMVFHVLENKPDGYLLKTTQKNDLLDALHRFFAESMFRMSL